MSGITEAAAASNSPACVACTGEMRFFGSRLGYTYVQCGTCGTLQLHPLPTKSELLKAYGDDYASAGHCDTDAEIRRGTANPYYRAIVDAFEKHGGKGPVLDHGAGWGGLTELVLAKGYVCTGVEPSVSMASHCARLGLPVRHGDFWAADNGPYGAILMSAVFEHIVEHDAWLRRANQVVEQDGLIVSMQPTALFGTFVAQLLRLGVRGVPLPQLHQVFCPPWHTVLFTIEGMRMLFARYGFELEGVYPGPQGRSPGLTGIAQRLLGGANRIGWPLLGVRWPLLICHIFVLRKRSHVPDV
ncbi:MAG: class I SAM-dependent methyltransferase [Candidatus Hydrogenedentes bacterium]|nr:class I SAM-dependent methyltransferase [Candidatus Hydrogenedentota bacterium]